MLEEDGRLRNLRAENYILNQRISAEWIYASEEWKKEARQFCVKGLAEIDMLKEIQAKLEEAQRKGLGLRQFKKQIVPYLQEKGWLGGDEKEIGHRVRIIFDTNLASARASAKWQKIQETKDKMPYLQYLPSLSADKRDEHKAFYGLIARADDEIWQRIFPPNGYNCKCRTRQLTEKQAQKLIKEQEENGGRITVDNNAINKAVDSSFQHCHADLSGFWGYLENRKRTKEEKKRGKTAEQKKEENLTKSLAVKNKLLEHNLAKTVLDLSPKTEKDYKGRINWAYPTIEEAYQTFKTRGANLIKKYLPTIKAGVARELSPYEIFQPILQDLRATGGRNLNYVGENLNLEHKNIIDHCFSRYPERVIKILNESDRKIIVVERAKETGKSDGGALFLKDLDKIIDAVKNTDLKMQDLQTGDALLYLPFAKSRIEQATTAIHEIAHPIQYYFPEIQTVFRMFFNERTKGEKRQHLPLYPSDVLGKKDHFSDPYMGRTYEENFFSNKSPEPLELMPMSYQAILGDDFWDLSIIVNGYKEKNINLNSDVELLGFALATLEGIAKWK